METHYNRICNNLLKGGVGGVPVEESSQTTKVSEKTKLADTSSASSEERNRDLGVHEAPVKCHFPHSPPFALNSYLSNSLLVTKYHLDTYKKTPRIWAQYICQGKGSPLVYTVYYILSAFSPCLGEVIYV